MSTAPVAPAPRRHRPAGAGPAVLPAAEPARHRRDIEGLRAVAVLLVVAYHCGLPFVGGGYVGVDVFFVISGFLITGLLLREAQRTGRVSIARFYARRALRLLPASAVVVVATVTASAVWLPQLRLSEVVSDALHTSVYTINWRLAAIGTDYLSAELAPSPLQHFWSLAVEEQFYLVWPLLLLVVLRRGSRRLTLVLAAFIAGSLAVSLWQTRNNADWAYFGTHTRAWELGIGALLAVGAARLRRLPPPAAKLLIGSGLASVVVAALSYTAATPFPGYAALLPVLGTAGVIAGGCAQPAGLLGAPVLQSIGRLSYSWYLWHWPVLLITPFVLGRSLAVWENVLVALGALVLAALTYALVENPVRHLTALREQPWRGLTAGAAISLLAAGLCVLIAALAGTSGSTGYQAPALTGVAKLQQNIALAAELPAVPANLTPALDRAAKDKPRFYREGCSGDFADPEVKKPCAYGDLSSPTTVVLFGDSHAGHWFPALEDAARQRHWKLVVVTKSACTAADGIIFLKQLKRRYTECGRWRQEAWRYTRSLRPAMVVVASTYPSNDLLDVTGSQDDAWAAAWQRSISRLSAPGTKVFFINDTPWLAEPVPDCLSANADRPSACVRDRQGAVNLPGRRRLIADTARAGGATVIDPVPWFCTATQCPPVIGNVLVYRDRHHVTTVYSRLLAPLLAEALRP